MGDKRLELHEILCGIISITEPDGDRHTYFQPPPSVKLRYPALVYSRKNIENLHANDSVYKQKNSYELTLIDRDPDSKYIEKILALPMCRFDRHYISDNLNHDTFTLYY